MNAEIIIQELEKNQAVFVGLFEGLESRTSQWKPSENKWSLLEILCHLYDEERDDFRTRVRHCLENSSEEAPGINPEGWVKERNYAGRNYEEMLAKFLAERKASVAWLKEIKTPDWSLAYKHPDIGYLSAGLFLTNWLAHDYLHIRQITRHKYNYLRSEISSEDLRYAGEF